MFAYVCATRIPSSSDLRRNLARTLDSVVDDHRPVIVTGNGRRTPVVLISLEDYAAFDGTRYLSSTEANARCLRESIAELRAGRVRERDLIA